MDNANAKAEEQPLAPETPEDVAILYSWANLPGAKYRDFSASRREYRAQQRARAAEAQRQAELKAAQELEEAAQREVERAQKQVEITQQAEAKAAADAAAEAEAKREAEEILRAAEQRADQERQEAMRRQQSAEDLRLMAERAQEEMLEARKRAEEQAARYAEAEQGKHQTGTQNRVLPGETTDPYYYSGPVDPAYFASTPGVRTAQPARVSTERKAYVHAVPGDSASLVAYRGAAQFAPSPNSMSAERGWSLQENADDRGNPRPGVQSQSLSVPRPEVDAQESDDSGYDLDDDYYDGGNATRLFSPSSRTNFGVERSPADLHIRPASRVSKESTRQARPVRPSPVSRRVASQDLRQAQAEHIRNPEIFEKAEGMAEPEEDFLPNDSYAADMAFLAAEAGPRREALLQETKSEPVMEPFDSFFPAADGDDRKKTDKGAAGRHKDDTGVSRMFLPSPRRRLLQKDAEPTGKDAFDRDAAAVEGQLRSQKEVDARTNLDRFVQAQESETADLAAGKLEDALLNSDEAQLNRNAPVQWRSLNRAGEGGFRRRQPGREPVARTTRQPRFSQESENAETSEQAPPPAWLSGDRSEPKAGDASKVEGGAGPDVPAIQGDPGVPGPRPVVRRQPSSLRPRAQRSESAARPNKASSDPAVLAAMNRMAQDARRPEDAADGGAVLGSSADTLQQSRERVASRWFALSGIMGAEGRPSGDTKVGQRSAPRPAPVLSVLSISGGVGKTSIVATLGRALSSMGEKVMLADTNVHGILPYYFGAREQRPGAVRTFSPPPGSSDASVVLVSYDADSRAYDEAGQKRVLEDLHRRSTEVQRVLVDAGVNSAWLAQTVAAGTNPWVLVPVAPDMNSVLGTQAVERLFQDVIGAGGRPVKPFYVLNQYDPSVPLHLDVREVLQQFLGDRLLPIMLQRTPVVSEALAEGMTVIDYAPRAPIAMDYMRLAAWVRKLADPGLSYARPARWSER